MKKVPVGSVISTKVPDTLVLIIVFVLVAWLLTFVVTPGFFETETVHYRYGEQQVEKIVLKASSYQAVSDGPNAAPIFEQDNESSLLSFAFNGLTSGNQYSAAVGVIMFILLIGGSFGILMQTKAIDKALLRLLVHMKGKDILLVPILCLLFSLGGAVFGMGEEAIAFALILTPLMVSLGFDAITAVMCTYVATQIGFATSWMNPFNVAIAQGLAGVPVMSGSGFRFAMWIVFTTVLTVYTWRYAIKVKRQPSSSKSYLSDDYFRKNHDLKSMPKEPLSFGEWLVLLSFAFGVLWVIWGVVAYGFYIPEIATQFFVMGCVCGIIAACFNVNGLSINQVADGFRKGASDLLPAALVVGFAQGILAVLGGTDPETPSVLNSLLHSTANLFDGLSQTTSAIFMLFFQSIFNFFVTSGSGQAALTIPLMAPLADLVSVTRQTAVLAFQLGDGITNIFVPTSASLMGTLGVAKIQWASWASFIFKFLLLNFVLAITCIVIAVSIGY